MRTAVGTLLGAGLVTVGCTTPPPNGPRPPIVLQTQGDGTITATATAGVTPLTLGPTMTAMTLISGPSSPWGANFAHLADAEIWRFFGWGNGTGSLANVDTGQAAVTRNGNAWSNLSGLTNGGLGATIPASDWDPRRAWASPSTGSIAGMGAGGLGAMEAPPGWGNKTWGPSTPVQGGSTWGQQTKPGMFNLSRGAAGVGGWGLDNGFFTIPQEEKRQQMDAYLHQVNTSPNGRPGAGQTNLDQTKFPFLRPVKGPLVPPK